jgi:hypothetical protein
MIVVYKSKRSLASLPVGRKENLGRRLSLGGPPDLLQGSMLLTENREASPASLDTSEVEQGAPPQTEALKMLQENCHE